MINNSLFRIILTSIVLCCFTGCEMGKNLHPIEELTRADSQATYRVNPGDMIMIDVWGEPKLSGQQFIRDDGSFTMPLVGDIPASGKSLKDIGTQISQKLKEFVPGASVSVSVVRAAPIKYYLSGAFMTPGEFRSEGTITLLQAVAAGGGFAPFADESEIILIRKTSQGDARYKLDYNKLIDGRHPNPELQNGDIIAVH